MEAARSKNRNIVVIGASAGGVEALRYLISKLPANLDAAVFATIHMPPHHRSYLPEVLNYNGTVPAVAAEDGSHIHHGRMYVSVPDHHLMIENDRVRLVRGPKENRHRPAIDPLFRSAAYWHGPRVIGIILTGSLDDGTAGLRAIKQRGGVCIVQDPREALYPGMPLSAIRNVNVDHQVRLGEIPSLLNTLTQERAPSEDQYPITKLLEKEYKLQGDVMKSRQDQESPGKPSPLSCPECGGVLWEIDDSGQLRFRCRVGHAFTVDSVIEEQSDAVEKALWSALKTLEESASLSERIIDQANQSRQHWLSQRFQEKLQEARNRASAIQKVLSQSEKMVTLEDQQKRAIKRVAVPKTKSRKKIRRPLATSEK